MMTGRMRFGETVSRLAITAVFAAGAFALTAADSPKKPNIPGPAEDYVRAPMPAEFHVEITELAGPVFADATGKTLYRWPLKNLRNGDAGEQKGKPSCSDHVFTETSGLMSPYPPGLVLPDVETRPSCVQLYPPVLAPEGAKPVAKWTILARPDGRKQWAYDGYALYTSVFDKKPGDVIGGVSGTGRKIKADVPAIREAVGPSPNIPALFKVTQVATGRMLSAFADISVYTYDKDGPNKSNCDAACLRDWSPVVAPETTQPQGEWTVFERAPGIKQWAFRKQPLYIHNGDEGYHTMDGSDVPGWHNVYTQKAPLPPKGFTEQDTRSGQVLADAKGRTLYVYKCTDDALDQLPCDHPDTPQAYRLAIGGDNDPAVFMKTWPYVVADKNARSDNQTWAVMDINTKTGKRAQAGDADALRVWAYNDRPVYYFYDDKKPGDVEGDAWGEFTGKRNGFKAFWLRDAFRENAE
jgi:predicted lipoprotein with Yx(FWY)xxD motif